MVEHLSTNPKVLGSVLGRFSNVVMDYDEACVMHFTHGVVQNFLKAWVCRISGPYAQKRSKIFLFARGILRNRLASMSVLSIKGHTPSQCLLPAVGGFTPGGAGQMKLFSVPSQSGR